VTVSENALEHVIASGQWHHMSSCWYCNTYCSFWLLFVTICTGLHNVCVWRQVDCWHCWTTCACLGSTQYRLRTAASWVQS